jgi:hypothetical protein
MYPVITLATAVDIMANKATSNIIHSLKISKSKLFEGGRPTRPSLDQSFSPARYPPPEAVNQYPTAAEPLKIYKKIDVWRTIHHERSRHF